MRDDELRCLAAGMNAYITKPIDWPTLYATVESYVASARAGSLS